MVILRSRPFGNLELSWEGTKLAGDEGRLYTVLVYLRFLNKPVHISEL